MGHAFVLKMMLVGERLWESEEARELDYVKKEKKGGKVEKGVSHVGFLVKSKDKFLLAHNTPRELDEEKKDCCWSILKGNREEEKFGEDISNCVHLFKQYTGIDLQDSKYKHLVPPEGQQPLKTLEYGKKGCKKATVYLLEDKEGLLLSHEAPLTCSTKIEGTFARVELRGKPFYDKFAWVCSEEAEKMVTFSQKSLFK